MDICEVCRKNTAKRDGDLYEFTHKDVTCCSLECQNKAVETEMYKKTWYYSTGEMQSRYLHYANGTYVVLGPFGVKGTTGVRITEDSGRNSLLSMIPKIIQY